MTTIVTRLYESETQASAVVARLTGDGFPASTYDVLTTKDKAAMEAAGLSADAAGAYNKAMKAGNAMLVVRAPFTPFGAARAAIAAADSQAAIEVDAPKSEYKEVSQTTTVPKIMHGYWADFLIPHISKKGTVTGAMGFNVLSDRKPMGQTIRHGFWGDFVVPHLSNRKPTGKTIMHGFWADFIVPHLSKSERKSSVTPGGGHPFSEIFGLRLLSKR